MLAKMRPDRLKMHQKAFRGRAPHGPAGGAYSAPPDPLAATKGPTSKGRGGRKWIGREGRDRDGEGMGRGREGEGRGRKGERRGGKGRGGKVRGRGEGREMGEEGNGREGKGRERKGRRGEGTNLPSPNPGSAAVKEPNMG